MKKILIPVFLLGFAVSCTSGFYKLDSSNSIGYGPVSFNAPYTSVVKYFGFVDPGSKPDGNYKGKSAYYLYFWVPAAIDEVGVAMYSPATVDPSDDDFVSASFKKNFGQDKTSYFDTYLALERMAVLDAAKIKDGNSAATQMLDTNDDTSEIPANPGGSHYNSLLRVKTSTSDPTKALVRSVYRITFTSFRGNVKGSFVAQVGTNIPGVKIAASLDELHKLVNEPAQE